MKQHFYSNGKLLLTGEYVVLDGATALAIPTKFGQSLEIEKNNTGKLQWQSFTNTGEIWFEAFFNVVKNEIKLEKNNVQNSVVAENLLSILNKATGLNSKFLADSEGFSIKTQLSFPRDWGLGSSSTLINNIAQWAGVNAFELLQNTMGGSGYDIAAAQQNIPILYSLGTKLNLPNVQPVKIGWTFKESIFFIYLNKKQNSRDGIKMYRESKISAAQLSNISEITKKMLQCNLLSEFEELIIIHEKAISKIIKIEPIKNQLFKEYPHAIKSLGAWGGDFIMVIGDEEKMEYFRKKGYDIIFPYETMIK